MTAVPKVGQLGGVPAGFGNKTRIEHYQARPMGEKALINQGPIQADKVERLIKLARIRARRHLAEQLWLRKLTLPRSARIVVNRFKRNFRCDLLIANSLSIFSARFIVPFASCVGFFGLAIEDTNVRKRHFFVKRCPQYW